MVPTDSEIYSHGLPRPQVRGLRRSGVNWLYSALMTLFHHVLKAGGEFLEDNGRRRCGREHGGYRSLADRPSDAGGALPRAGS